MLQIHSKVIDASAGEDYVLAQQRESSWLLVLADGAGGSGAGGLAARQACEFIAEWPISGALTDWSQVLCEADEWLFRQGHGGECAIAVVEVSPGQVYGASVGDCEAWLVEEGGVFDLTEHQRHKPLLGSRESLPVFFGPWPMGQSVLLGSDGLFKYASRASILHTLQTSFSEDVVDNLIRHAQLENGAFHDDVSVIFAARQG